MIGQQHCTHIAILYLTPGVISHVLKMSHVFGVGHFTMNGSQDVYDVIHSRTSRSIHQHEGKPTLVGVHQEVCTWYTCKWVVQYYSPTHSHKWVCVLKIILPLVTCTGQYDKDLCLESNCLPLSVMHALSRHITTH